MVELEMNKLYCVSLKANYMVKNDPKSPVTGLRV